MASGKDYCYALNMQRRPDGSVKIPSNSGGPDIPVDRIAPHPNTAQLIPGRQAVGNMEYGAGGRAKFSFQDAVPRDGKTAHEREYEQTTGRQLGSGHDKTITGTGYRDGRFTMRSSTHNTGQKPHNNPEYYTSDGSREARPVEQNLQREVMDAWQRDGQPRSGWEYDPRSGQAMGPNANRRK